MPEPQSVIKANDKPIIPPGSGNNNKAYPKVSAPKAPDLVQKDTSSLRRYSRVGKPNRKYIDIVSLVKNILKTLSSVNWLPLMLLLCNVSSQSPLYQAMFIMYSIFSNVYNFRIQLESMYITS